MEFPLQLYVFAKYPTTCKVDLSKKFIGVDEETRIFLDDTARLRNAMIAAIGRDSPKIVGDCISLYAKNLAILVAHLETHPQTATNGALVFEWSSAFQEEKTGKYASYTYQMEMCMTHIALACARMNQAAEACTLKTLTERLYDDVTNPLKEAALAFYFVQKRLENNWPERRAPRVPVELALGPRFAELMSEYALALAHVPIAWSAMGKPKFIQSAATTAAMVETRSDALAEYLCVSGEYSKMRGDRAFFNFLSAQNLVFGALQYLALTQHLKSTDLGAAHVCAAAALKKITADVAEHTKGLGHMESYTVQIAAFVRVCSQIQTDTERTYHESPWAESMPLSPPPVVPKQLYTLDIPKETDGKAIKLASL